MFKVHQFDIQQIFTNRRHDSDFIVEIKPRKHVSVYVMWIYPPEQIFVIN